MQSAAAVVAVNQPEKPAHSVEDEDREDARARRQELESDTPTGSGRYARKLVYERELDRTFLDVVDRDDEERLLMRMPPEKLVRFLADHSHGLARPESAAPQLDLMA